MREFKDKNLSERLKNASQAKQARLQRIRELPGADHPSVLERKAAQLALAAARQERAEAKLRADKENAEREAALEAERAALRASELKEEGDRLVAKAAEQKAIRDARYTARKVRKI